MTAAPTVMGLLGALGAEDLGLTLVHEHVFFGADGVALDGRVLVDERSVADEAVTRLSVAAQLGLRTVVDATPIEMHRRPEVLADIAARSGVQFVCATGLYTSSHGIPAHFRHMDEADLQSLFEHELTEGMGDTRLRAGVIKVATSPGGVDEQEAKVLRAAAGAHLATGAPIITHTSGDSGVEQLDILLAAGVDAGRVLVGHLDHRHVPPSTVLRVMARGAFAGFDRVGRDAFLPDTVRAGLVAGLLADGHAGQLCLSMDSALSLPGNETATTATDAEPYVHVLGPFCERLRGLGVTDDELRTLLVVNPRRLLLGV